MDFVKESMQEWLEQLESEKKELADNIKAAEVALEVLRAKFFIAERAMKKLPHRKHKDFYEKYVKPLEEEVDTREELIEKQKAENREKINELNALIETLKE